MMNMRPSLPVFFLCSALLAPQGLFAQDGADRPASEEVASSEERRGRALLTPEDYGRWERMENPSLSADGRWLSYRVRSEDEDAVLRIHLLGTDSLIVVPRGSAARFSSDGRWLAYTYRPSEEDRERFASEGRAPTRVLVLVDTETGEEREIPGVTEFRFSADSRFIAMRHGSFGSDRNGGGDVVVRGLSDGSMMSFGNVAVFDWGPVDALLAFIVDAEERVGNGVRLYDAHEGRIRSLASSRTVFRGLVWREDRADLAVLEVLEGADAEATEHAVWAWRGLDGPSPTGQRLHPDSTARFPSDARISENRPLRWSRAEEALFLGLRRDLAPAEEETDGEDEAVEEDDREAGSDEEGAGEGTADEGEPDVEVWHAADVRPVPQQKVRAMWEERSTALAVWWLEEHRFIPLQEEHSQRANLTAGDRLVLDLDEAPYERERMFGPAYRDVYAIDPATGEREKIRERVQHFFGASPGGRYVLYLQDDDFWVYDRDAEEHRNVTYELPATFVDLEDDHTVEQKPPFGHAGWTVGDEWVLLYDRFNVWKVAPDGSGGTRLTDGAEERIRYRYVYLDGFEEPIDLDEPVYLRMTGERSKKSGYARLDPGADTPERLVWRDRHLSRLTRADSAQVYAFVVEGFEEPPNVHVGGPDLGDAQRVTDLNAFQSEYHWGRAELVDYESREGDALQAALFYPADYDPDRTYPMIVHPYERRSDVLHRYEVPTEREPYNATVWTQRGYFVLAPDIAYRARNPGLSALDALEPAVDAAVATGRIDRDRVGLIGHSWGGYQTTFVLTQTDRFAAGVAGAPLTNLISMYLSFFWNTGDPDARIFETSQARMEVPWWEDHESYVANSPVHHIQTLETPLLMAFGTEDGAVDFHQGVEFYNAARRTGKEFVLLVYEGEGHSLRRRPNRVDLHRRILEWFDHYLKDEPAPSWITDGMPYDSGRSGTGGR